MEKLFENVTTYDKEEYKKFVIFHNKKYNLKYNLYTLFVLLLILFCSVSGFFANNIRIGILFLLIAFCFALYRLFHPYLFVKKEAKSKKITEKLTNTYTFYEKFFIIKNKQDTIKLKYYKLYKIFETKDCFYLYLNKTHAFVLSKNTFKIGDSTNFYNFIKNKLWFRLIIKNN